MTDGDKRSAEDILRTDQRGRVRSTAAQRQLVLEQFERSGLSGPQFARVAGIAYQTFVSWRKKQQRSTLAVSQGGPANGAAPMRLVEAVLAHGMDCQQRGNGGLKVELPGGCSVLVNGSSQVPLAAQLIKAIAAPC